LPIVDEIYQFYDLTKKNNVSGLAIICVILHHKFIFKDRLKMEPLTSMPGSWMPLLILLVIAWTLPWKGVALWRSARNSHTAWFVVLLIVNTLAILEIIYICGFSKKKPQVS